MAKGETQRERRTRNKRRAYAAGIYGRSTAMPKDWGRAMRRHPPTTCTACGKELIWYIPLGHYVVKGLEDILELCADAPRKSHIPANGKRPHRFAD